MTGSSNVPPGLGNITASVYAEGGNEHAWRPIQQTRLYTNAFVIEDSKLLLGFKKRGIGAGLFNGFGGKVEPGETPAQAARRELQEEAGIEAPLAYAGTLLFTVAGVDQAFDIRIYAARTYTGVPSESDEMTPQWFALDSDSALPPIPYTQMWADDVHWLPRLVRGERFVGRADFDEGNVMVRYWFGSETA